HKVVVLEYVIPYLQAYLAGALGLCLTPCLKEILVADDLGANEPLLDIRMNGARRLPGRDPLADRPSPVFFAPHGQEGDVASLFEGTYEQPIRFLQFPGL